MDLEEWAPLGLGAVIPHVLITRTCETGNLWGHPRPPGSGAGVGCSRLCSQPSGTAAHSKSDNPKASWKGKGGHPQSAGQGQWGHVAVERSLGEWSLILKLAGQARELGLGSAGCWEPLLILEQM